jgi:putative hydrolase of the HAD superfamily
MLKAVVFDFGGVILDLTKKPSYNIAVSLAQLFSISKEEAEAIWKKEHEWLVIGQETPTQFIDRVKESLNFHKSTEDILIEWNKLHLKESDHINWKLMEFVEQLKQKYKVYVLSNTIDVGQNDAVTVLIKSKFDGYFVSYETGFLKPDPQAFQYFLNSTGFQASECMLVDDSAANITAASALGFNTYHYASK